MMDRHGILSEIREAIPSEAEDIEVLAALGMAMDIYVESMLTDLESERSKND